MISHAGDFKKVFKPCSVKQGGEFYTPCLGKHKKLVKMENIKTLDIWGKSWFDKVNGNSYFSAQVSINFGMSDEKTVYVPFQYGYGDSYIYESMRQLQTDGILPEKPIYGPSTFCRDNGIILRTSKTEKCLKREVIAWGRN